MKKFDSFIFKDYSFNEQSKVLTLVYSFDNEIDFSETYRFDFDFAQYNEAQLDRAIQNLFFMAGVSYFKAAVPNNIVINKGELDKELADFFSKTYSRGLGEFWYVNKIDPKTVVNFPSNTEHIDAVDSPSTNNGMVIGLGGGKDSLVIIEALRDKFNPITTWSLNHKEQLEPLVKRIGLNHFYVERVIDKKLLVLNDQGALNGHIPISAIIACAGIVTAILSGNRDVVVSNEHTANEPTLTYEGVEINHQYSKTQEFEKDFQAILTKTFGDSVRYYSFLRPLSELRIAEIFAATALDKYLGVFSSCNKAYTLSSNHMSWCGTCPKCVFMFLILTPFVERTKLESIWGGKNLLLDPALSSTLEELLGISGNKPLDCVGEIKESRMAMRMDQKVYPELSKYSFYLPEDYDYKNIWDDELPEDIKPLFTDFISQF
jgi:hypothetical protein